MAALPWLSWRTSPRRRIEDVRLFVNPRHWLTWPCTVVFIAVYNKCVILLSKWVTLNAAPCNSPCIFLETDTCLGRGRLSCNLSRASQTLTIGSKCFGQYYAHHQELTTIPLITTLTVPFLGCCGLEVRWSQAGYVSGLQAITCDQQQPKQPDGPCGNEHYSNELLMMGIILSETCWVYRKFNKIIWSI